MKLPPRVAGSLLRSAHFYVGAHALSVVLALVSFILATLVASAITTVVLPPSDLSVFTLFDALGLPLFLASCLAVGLYKGAGPSTFERLRLRGFAIFLFITAKLLLCALLGSIATKLPGAVILSVLLVPTGLYLEILVRQQLTTSASWAAPTLVVGTDDRVRSIFKHLDTQPELGLRSVGHLSANKSIIIETTGSRPENPIDARVSMGSASEKPIDIRVFGRENKFESIVLTHPEQYRALSCFDGTELAGCRKFIAYDVDRLPSLWPRTRSLGDNVVIEAPGGLQLRRNRWLKRATDIAIGGPALLLVLPLIAAMMIAIKIIDPGPAFFLQRRIGAGGRPIEVFKIRTMCVDAEQRLKSIWPPARLHARSGSAGAN